ncbi:outer membrane beta-barrel protein [Fulvivirga ligni]|uniref:outer membrane beta-barrel protein n=1 Tax=Fulvivirga ligni TaxID=2904246 RepID=UPI001F3560C3|nr:outer membrane beta-barrel protein [Fulvivirga ligni]UII22600.1 porin family protein [Fulvivirga ligni]
MKKQIFTLFVILAAFTFINQEAKAQIRAGAQLVYGTEAESPGLGLNGEYQFTESWAASVSFNYFFPRDLGYYDLKWFEVNLNAQYHFDVETVKPYALAGLNITTISLPYNYYDVYGSNSSNTEIGLNLGAGANIDLGSKFMPFAELRYVISDADQLVLGAGVKYIIKE